MSKRKTLTVDLGQELYDQVMEIAMKESIGSSKRVSMGEWVRRVLGAWIDLITKKEE
jgi:hypothetical protein